MLDDQRPGTIYWIDHYVIPTEDIDRFEEFHINVLGARTQPTSPERRRQTGIFQDLAAPCHLGGFVQKHPVPSSAGLGKGLPRNGHFIRQQDIDDHLRRLDANHANHTDPVHTSAEGDEGINILWEDPDGNQFEFWAPDRMPEGAMGEPTATKVGRISHGVFESRNLQRTADLFNRYCALEPLRNSDIPADTLVLPLAAGGRLVFKKVETLGGRTSGFGKLNACHAALVVRDEDFVPNYQRMFADLPDWELDANRNFVGGGPDLPPRTARHGSPAGSKFYDACGRGDDWYDWDSNQFHFYGGAPKDGSMVEYEPHSMEFHVEEILKALGRA